VRIAVVTDTYTPQVNGVTTVVHRIVEALTAAAFSTRLGRTWSTSPPKDHSA
jgi:hypothetical protein